MGRQLKGIKKGSLEISYKYDDGGIRTEKTVNGATTTYHLLGDKVTYEETGADKIYYTYDAAGNIATMTLNGVEYYYLRNGQNDIIGLVDKTGTQVVSYTYDSWGKLISIDGSLKASVGAKNPYRYRGYRYDTETGLYYLNSRYYNPEWGRFINADGLVSTGQDIVGHNMFAYCLNNPVNMSDINGFLASSICDGVGGTVKKPAIIEQVISVGKYTVTGTGDYAIGSAIENSLKNSIQRSYKANFVFSGDITLQTFKQVPKTLKMADKVTKVGVGAISVGMTGYSLWDNHANYSPGIAWKRDAIDVLGFGITCGLGAIITAGTLAALPAGALTILIGVGISYTADEVKKWISN